MLRGDKYGAVDGVEIEFAVDSEEPREAIEEMIALAHRMCFTEAALSQPVPIRVRHLLNGQPLD